ncbi:unnamed protein product [Rhizophagus irregularis]|nr:unnamed protein product [Rhizophagus irregularis]
MTSSTCSSWVSISVYRPYKIFRAMDICVRIIKDITIDFSILVVGKRRNSSDVHAFMAKDERDDSTWRRDLDVKNGSLGAENVEL